MESGSVLRGARRDARLSQSDVARRSGVAQSVISAYESGRREPGIRTLARLVEATGRLVEATGRLVEATGHRLVLDIVPAPGRTFGLPDTPLGRRLRRRRRAIVETASRRGAQIVRAFGRERRARQL
jgi:predicted transcriptional regulator